MKKIITLFLAAALSLPLFAVSESDAKVDLEDANKAYSEMTKMKDLREYLPYKEYYFSKVYTQLAAKMMNDGQYEKSSYYSILALTSSKTAVAKAQIHKTEMETISAERDYYKKIVETDTTWVSVALLEAGMKRKGKSNTYESKMTALDAFGGTYEMGRPDQIKDVDSKFTSSLDKIYKVLSKQKDTILTIQTKSQKDYRNNDLSTAYGQKIQDYFIEKGKLDTARVKIDAKGRGPYKGEILLILENVDAK